MSPAAVASAPGPAPAAPAAPARPATGGKGSGDPFDAFLRGAVESAPQDERAETRPHAVRESAVVHEKDASGSAQAPASAPPASAVELQGSVLQGSVPVPVVVAPRGGMPGAGGLAAGAGKADPGAILGNAVKSPATELGGLAASTPLAATAAASTEKVPSAAVSGAGSVSAPAQPTGGVPPSTAMTEAISALTAGSPASTPAAKTTEPGPSRQKSLEARGGMPPVRPASSATPLASAGMASEGSGRETAHGTPVALGARILAVAPQPPHTTVVRTAAAPASAAGAGAAGAVSPSPSGPVQPAREKAPAVEPSPPAAPSPQPLVADRTLASPPAAATPATPTPAASTPSLTSQLARPVFTLAAAGAGEHVMTVHVTPDALGPVTVQAHVGGEGVRVELFAPTDAGRDALRAILPDLRRDLSGAGLSGTLDLSSQSQPSPHQDPSAAGPHPFAEMAEQRRTGSATVATTASTRPLPSAPADGSAHTIDLIV